MPTLWEVRARKSRCWQISDVGIWLRHRTRPFDLTYIHLYATLLDRLKDTTLVVE